MEATVEEQLIAHVRTLSPAQQQDVLHNLQGRTQQRNTSWEQFIGTITPEDLALMEQAIEEDCEKVDADGW